MRMMSEIISLPFYDIRWTIKWSFGGQNGLLQRCGNPFGGQNGFLQRCSNPHSQLASRYK